ncbi:MAG: FKBP-type peptidyl-prolyl cis-trans isomerase SlyD [Porticoccaceae bacterium]|jgi:FKBP-type peptidyl-prolyl cis-trans isomerase SlyD|tara:strand:+ start:1615 stop:2133 length:519 start_codon:yes stop_codon:yes gene_type:complete
MYYTRPLKEPTMYVSAHHVISVHYTLTDDDNALIDSTYDDNKPMVYLHGRGQMIIGFEQAVAKAEIGEKRNFTVAPNEGYGLRNVNNTQRIPIKYLKHEGKLSIGKAIHVNTDNGVKPGTVIKVGRFNVDVDMNHPLAGKNLTFEVEIVDIRKATKEETDHGHVHGDQGCNH